MEKSLEHIPCKKIAYHLKTSKGIGGGVDSLTYFGGKYWMGCSRVPRA